MPGSGIRLDILNEFYGHTNKKLNIDESNITSFRIPLSWIVTGELPESLNYYDKGMMQIETDEDLLVVAGDDYPGIRLSKLITSNRKLFGYENSKIAVPEWASKLSNTINNMINIEYENSD